MKLNIHSLQVEVDEQGHLILPPEISKRFGLVPGAVIQVEEGSSRLNISRSSAALAKIYIEPTNLCNLDCRTCMRNVWDEPLGLMSDETFSKILQGAKQFSSTPTIFFGGFGEPLVHPKIIEMVQAAKVAGSEVELITNGILLNEAVSGKLMDAGLDRIWVSIDGATPESYEDVRLGASLPQVIENLMAMQKLRTLTGHSFPKLGIAFVAMKRNIADLPKVVRIGKRLGADQFSISNVLPHTQELKGQVLYGRSIYERNNLPSQWVPLIALPRLEMNALTKEPLAETLKDWNMLSVARQELEMGANTCPFVEKGSISIRWDGAASPCLPLLHTHESYLDEHLRQNHSYSVGNINKHSLLEVWNNPAYVKLRERLLEFDFSPCTICNSCEMAEANLEDCFGNVQPACGGCLWAQGFIQCP
ncbi:MAG: SPASM domain-containing protein [Anaerolineaceae bacterium]|nr:SPASM domain-containing protein [Anaerolineaceae bacterium]